MAVQSGGRGRQHGTTRLPRRCFEGRVARFQKASVDPSQGLNNEGDEIGQPEDCVEWRQQHITYQGRNLHAEAAPPPERYIDQSAGPYGRPAVQNDTGLAATVAPYCLSSFFAATQSPVHRPRKLTDRRGHSQ